MNKVLLPLFYFIASFTLSVKEVILFYSSAVNQDCGLRKKLFDETVLGFENYLPLVDNFAKLSFNFNYNLVES